MVVARTLRRPEVRPSPVNSTISLAVSALIDGYASTDRCVAINSAESDVPRSLMTTPQLR